MISASTGPLPSEEQSVFVVLCVLLFAWLDHACIQMRSAAAYIHPPYCGQAGPLAHWLPKSKHHLCWKPPSVWPSHFLSPMVYITGYCANGKLLCLIITTLSRGCRRRSGAKCVFICVCVSVWNDVEGKSCWALSFESQVTTLLFQRTPLVFIILPPHQVQGAQPHAWTCTSWWETERTPQVFWPVKISLLVWHFLSCPHTPILPTPFYTWVFVLLWKETYISQVCQATHFQKVAKTGVSVSSTSVSSAIFECWAHHCRVSLTVFFYNILVFCLVLGFRSEHFLTFYEV